MTPGDPFLRIGISQCLIGDEVRYDGGHKRNSALIEVFGDDVTWITVCPEVEVGMGTPREPLRLVGKGDEARMLGAQTGTDWTDPMRKFAANRVAELADADLDAYVLKSRSPSCGLHDGLFAQGLRKSLDLMPIAEETDLEDAWAMDAFIERAFAYRRLRAFFGKPRSLGELVLFHSQSKLQLELHEPESYERLSHLVVDPKSPPWAERARRYQRLFMGVLSHPAASDKHGVAMNEALDLMDPPQREVSDAVREFQAGSAPVTKPLGLFAVAVEEMQPPLLYMQTYVTPSSEEMILRNRVWL